MKKKFLFNEYTTNMYLYSDKKKNELTMIITSKYYTVMVQIKIELNKE